MAAVEFLSRHKVAQIGVIRQYHYRILAAFSVVALVLQRFDDREHLPVIGLIALLCICYLARMKCD